RGAPPARCLPLQRRRDRRAVEALTTDDDEARGARLAGAPGSVEIMLDAAADALHHLTQLLAGDGEEALEAEDVVRGDGGGEAPHELRRVGDRAALDDETLEIVVVVLAQGIEMRGPVGEIVLGGGAEAEEDFRRDLAVRGLDQLDDRPEAGRHLVAQSA